MGWLFTRESMIAFAVLGGLASLLAMWAQRGKRGKPFDAQAFNRLSYVFMAVSVVLFIIAGWRGPNP